MVTNISGKLLSVTLAFAVLGSMSSQQLDAMKRLRDGDELGDEREKKRRRVEVAEIDVDQIDPTEENFLKAIQSKNENLIGNIIDQKPEWMISGPLKYLTSTRTDIQALIAWFHNWEYNGLVLSQLINGEVPSLENITKIVGKLGVLSYNYIIVKSLCTDPRLSSDTIQHMLSFATYHYCVKDNFQELITILQNDQNVNPETLTKAFAFHDDDGCLPLTHAIISKNVKAVKWLINCKYVTRESINHALKQVAKSGRAEDRLSYGRFHPEREIDEIFKLLINDQRITNKGVNDALITCNDFDILEKLLKDHRTNAGSISQVLRKNATEFLPSAIINILIADKRINPRTIDQALLDSSSAEYGELKINYDDPLSRWNFHEKENMTNFNRKAKLLALLKDDRVTVPGINIALVFAATQGNKMAFEILRADPRVTNKSPFPLLDLMRQCPYAFREVASYLGVNPVTMQNDINQALFDAVDTGSCDAVALLLTLPEIKSIGVDKALIIAVNNNNLNVIKMMLESTHLTTKEINAAMNAALEKNYVRAFNLLRNDARATEYPKDDCLICCADYSPKTLFIVLPCCKQLLCLGCCNEAIGNGYQFVIQGFGNYGKEYHRCPFCKANVSTDDTYQKRIEDASKSKH